MFNEYYFDYDDYFNWYIFGRSSLIESLSSNDEGLNEVFFEDSSLVNCEQCGRLTEAHHQRGPRRFCSTSCARRYSVSCSRKMVAFHARSGRGGQHSSADQLASDRKSSFCMSMVSSLCFVKAQNSLTLQLFPSFLLFNLPYSTCLWPNPQILLTHHLLTTLPAAKIMQQLPLSQSHWFPPHLSFKCHSLWQNHSYQTSCKNHSFSPTYILANHCIPLSHS